MATPVYKDLLTQQINVLKAISYLTVAFMTAYLLLLYYVVGLTDTFPEIIIPYIIGVFLNMLLLSIHKKAYITYHILIIFTFSEIIASTLVSGGLGSPYMFLLITLPGYAFYTSRRQGKIWFVICILSTIVVFQAEALGITITDVMPEEFHNKSLFFNILFVLVLSSSYTFLAKREALKIHKSHDTLTSDLKGKSKRLENMVMQVNYSTELMCVIDVENLTFDEVNPVFKLSLGYELSELRDQHIRVLLKDEFLPRLSDAKEDDVVSFESPVLCLSGKIKKYSWLVVAKNEKLYASARELS